MGLWMWVQRWQMARRQLLDGLLTHWMLEWGWQRMWHRVLLGLLSMSRRQELVWLQTWLVGLWASLARWHRARWALLGVLLELPLALLGVLLVAFLGAQLTLQGTF